MDLAETNYPELDLGQTIKADGIKQQTLDGETACFDWWSDYHIKAVQQLFQTDFVIRLQE